MAGTPLTGADPVEIDGIVIHAPGLAGDIVVEDGAGAPRRDVADQVPPAIQRAMSRQKMRPRKTIRIEAPSDAATPSRGRRRSVRAAAAARPTRPARPEPIRIAVPKPPKTRAQVLLSRDEHGIVTWHFPTPPTRGDTLVPEGSDLFEIDRTPSRAPTRGFGLSKILQVVTFPVSVVAGKVVTFEIGKWDRDNHPTKLRAYGPDKKLKDLTDADWKRLQAGRCLLFIHGTFDTITGCFSGLADATLQELHKRYEGRVIAFDHPTLADSPIDNARALLKAVGDRNLEIDLVCHSRGGLVARSIIERPDDLAKVGPNLAVRTAVLVGATTNGTDLADVDRWNQLIDRLSTLLSFAPLPGAVDALETVFGLIRSIALETAHDLAGLDAMSPRRPFLKKLNQPVRVPAGTTYRVIDSDFEPADPDLKAFFADELKDDVVFHGPNDGMVAIDSIEGRPLQAPFPVGGPFTFGAAEGVEHASYFGQPKTSTALLGWLTGPGRAIAGATRGVAAAAAADSASAGSGGKGAGKGGGGGGGGRGRRGPCQEDDPASRPIGRLAMEQLIFRSSALRRYTQDSPVLPDVWFEYGANPSSRVDLLVTPYRSARISNPPGDVMKALARADLPDAARLAYNQSTVAVKLTFCELVSYLLPLAAWRFESRSVSQMWVRLQTMSSADRDDVAAQLIEFEQGRTTRKHATQIPQTVLWGIRLVGTIELARQGETEDGLILPDDTPDADKLRLARRLVDAAAEMIEPRAVRQDLVFSVSLNRPANVSVFRSVPTVKADAARGLFQVDATGIRWAVIDSGIDATHPAFRQRKRPTHENPVGEFEAEPFEGSGENAKNHTRVVETYDFTAVRELTDVRRLQRDAIEDEDLAQRLRVHQDLKELLIMTLKQGGPIRWTRFADLLRVPQEADTRRRGKVVKGYRPPANEHGTHVAGILAGDWRRSDPPLAAWGEPGNTWAAPDNDLIGVCPNLELYDLRVFGPDGTGNEYAVLAAIEFLQALTSEREFLTVHGVNMSFSIRHDVANYACGRTPICEDVTKLVTSGVVAVAAAGNDGYLRAAAGSEGGGEGYRTVSISDPGNCEVAITVGSTHSYRPYAYGVSYFSSRGPTGDGRTKPDLVAPGEKIWSAVPDGGARTQDGTSMAAPHVSGCAALLMGRYRELIGDPNRIKAILTSTASDLGRESYFQGHGLVDVLRAMQSI